MEEKGNGFLWIVSSLCHSEDVMVAKDVHLGAMKRVCADEKMQRRKHQRLEQEPTKEVKNSRA